MISPPPAARRFFTQWTSEPYGSAIAIDEPFWNAVTGFFRVVPERRPVWTTIA
jgi:hypothetical protein